MPATLSIGDYLLSPTSIIERKSLPDLAQSLRAPLGSPSHAPGRVVKQMRALARATAHPLLLIETDAEAGGGVGLVPTGGGGLARGYLRQVYSAMGLAPPGGAAPAAASTAAAAAAAGVSGALGTGAATWATPGLHPNSIGARLVALVVQFPTMRIVRLFIFSLSLFCFCFVNPIVTAHTSSLLSSFSPQLWSRGPQHSAALFCALKAGKPEPPLPDHAGTMDVAAAVAAAGAPLPPSEAEASAAAAATTAAPGAAATVSEGDTSAVVLHEGGTLIPVPSNSSSSSSSTSSAAHSTAALDLLRSLPGVTPTGATRLARAYPSLAALSRATQGELQGVIGEGNGKRLWRFINGLD